MKIINVIGGLGNQMFQCAFAIAVSKTDTIQEVKLDVSHFRGYNLHNGFEINRVFNSFPIAIARYNEIKKVTRYLPNYKFSRIVRRYLPPLKTEYIQPYTKAYIFDPCPLHMEGDVYYEGYWMCPAYFDFCKKDILKAFSFGAFDTNENKNWASLLATDNSVTIHVRRGDYVGASSFKDICTLAYYRNAIAEVRRYIVAPEFFVFSNDQEWCVENLKEEFGTSPVHFVANNKGDKSFRDMQLMSLAKCNILANSSFSWWGAYLNQREGHLVFCPEKWVNNFEHMDHYVNGWQKVSIL